LKIFVTQSCHREKRDGPDATADIQLAETELKIEGLQPTAAFRNFPMAPVIEVANPSWLDLQMKQAPVMATCYRSDLRSRASQGEADRNTYQSAVIP
jgi:hypothetical protein